MSAADLDTRQSVQIWLKDKPNDWHQALAMRAALRALPVLALANNNWRDENLLKYFRTIYLNWSYCRHRTISTYKSLDFINDSKIHRRNLSKNLINATTGIVNSGKLVTEGSRSSEIAAFSISNSVASLVKRSNLYNAADIWREVDSDCHYLENNPKKLSKLVYRRLWNESPPNLWMQIERQFTNYLQKRDQIWAVWLDWFERRIGGEHTAFDIPNDIDGIEDRRILARITEAANEDFWDKGAQYVNTTLQSWIDEARVRTTLPPQDKTAITYGINEEGKVDRLDASEQQQLRDTIDQRQKYADLREAAEELSGFGQRLGPRLSSTAPRLFASLPESFNDAEAYSIWRDATKVRRIMLAHKIAVQSPEPDESKLDPIVAIEVQGVIELYNGFALGDDTLRALDEGAIAPQERISAQDEAAIAKPVIEAILEAPETATTTAFADIEKIADAQGLPPDDPYAAQAQVQDNKTVGNYFAALISGVHNLTRRPGKVGAALATGAVVSVGKVVGDAALGSAGPIADFIVSNAPVLKAYAATVFSTYPIPQMIDDLIARLKR